MWELQVTRGHAKIDELVKLGRRYVRRTKPVDNTGPTFGSVGDLIFQLAMCNPMAAGAKASEVLEPRLMTRFHFGQPSVTMVNLDAGFADG